MEWSDRASMHLNDFPIKIPTLYLVTIAMKFAEDICTLYNSHKFVTKPEQIEVKQSDVLLHQLKYCDTWLDHITQHALLKVFFLKFYRVRTHP